MQSLLSKEDFPSADEVRSATKSDDIMLYSTWIRKAKKNICLASKKKMPYCYYHLKYYVDDRFDYVYASLVNREIRILNPIGKAEHDVEMLIGVLKKMGYAVVPFVGERPFHMNGSNLSTDGEDGNVMVGHGALGLYISWHDEEEVDLEYFS